MLKKIITLAVFALTGLLTGLVTNQINKTMEEGFSYLAGLVFGVGILIAYVAVKKTFSSTWIIWTGASTLAYYIATYSVSIFLNSWILAFFTAGAIGAAILSFGFNLLGKISLQQRLTLIVLGGVLGVIGTSVESDLYQLLFVVWQAGIATYLGWIVSQNLQENT